MAGNFFDQFDAADQANFFDRFDEALTAAPAAPEPQPYKNRIEALDDAVNFVEEGADLKQVSDAFAKIGIKPEEIVAHGQGRGSELFKQQQVKPMPAGQRPAPVEPSGEIKASDYVPKSSGLQRVEDISREFVGGAVSGVKGITDVAGANNPVSEFVGKARDIVLKGRSAEAKATDQIAAAIMKEAEDKGLWEQVKAGAEAFSLDPLKNISQGAGTIVPAYFGGRVLAPLSAVQKLGTLGARTLGVVGSKTAAETAGRTIIGGAMGAGMAKDQIYETVKNDAIESGLSEAEADAVAKKAQEYRENPSVILAAGALTAASSGIGVEAAVSRLMGRTAVKELAKAGVIKSTVKGVLAEAPLEAVQGGFEAFAGNVGSIGAGFDVSPMRGVGTQATMEGLSAAPVGGGLGAIEGLTAAPSAEKQFAREPERGVAGAQWATPADEVARSLLSTPQTASFTPPDSPTAQAGLAPIVVPLPGAAADQSLVLGDLNVGGTGVAGSAPVQGGLGGSGELRGGVGVSGLAGGDVLRGEVSVPAGAGLGAGAAAPAGFATSQRTAGLARATDTDLLGRAEAAVAQQPSTEPVQQWFGRKGDGYTTEADAAQALPGRQRMAPALNWKIEQMPSGKFRLAGYGQETTNGTQAPQAVQGQAQGPQAPAAGATAVDRFSALEQPQPELPDAVLAELSRDPGSAAARASVQQGLNNWAANTPGAVAPKLGVPDADAAAAVNVIGALIGDATGLGPRVVAYREEGGVNGFAMRGVALVNTASTSSVAAPRTGFHEIKHVAEQIARAETAAGLTNTPAQRFVAEIDSIFDDMTDEGKRAYVANFLQKEELDAITDPAAREQRLQELIADPETRSEMTADFLGNRATDRAFMIDLARTDPQGFEGFVKKWLAVIDNLIAKLRGSKTQNTKESAKVDQYVRDLTKAKMVARDALIAFRKGNLGEVRVEAGAEAAPQMSKKQESAADHKMEIEREDRELADKTKLARAEMDRVRASAKEFGLPIKMVELEVRRIKARFPEAAGWAPLEFLRIDKKTMDKKASEDNPLPSDAVFFVEQGYKFHLDPKTGKDAEATHEARVNAMASALAGEIMAKYMAAKGGDKVAQVIMRQSDWYRALRSKLRSTFGGFGDLFAQLLGPTSANNPVEPNFKYAVEALKMATSGKWDNLFKDVLAWKADIDMAATALDDVVASLKERKVSGGIKNHPEFKAAEKALREASVYKGEIPVRENGKMFGMATRGIQQILAESWGDKVAGDAPKTKNYYQNIMGRTIEATIDVWAARTLRRLANEVVGDLPRIPPVAETAVAGNVLVDNTTSGSEFGFGQEVFRKASDELRDSGVEQFRDVSPDAVQAMIWFAEKELWARRDWTTKVGEEGSIEHELLLAGYGDREQVDAWRVAARAGMPNPDAKAYQLKNPDKAKAKYEKAVAKWEEAKEIAKESLEQIERYPDRFVAGITTEIPDSVPTDREMASTGQEIDAVIGDDGVMAKRAQSSTGEFMGDFERTLDTEFVVRTGYNPTPVWNKLVEIADREGQQATFLSRVLRADELSNIDQTRHRPGVELYFAKPISMDQAKPLMGLINAAGVHGMTMVTEGRRTPSARRGEAQPIVGIRMQHIPEFMLGYGYEEDFTDAIIAQNILAASDKMDALVEQLDKRADISTVTRHWYETRVHFYGISERTAAGESAAGDREVWAGQSIREGLADAARFARGNQGAIGARRAELREQRAVSRRGGEEVQFSRVQPAGPAEPAGRPGGSTAASAAGANVTGIHYGKAAGLSALSGEKSGSGIKGAERARLDERGVDPRIKRRVYFYLTGNETEMVRPEPGLGPHVYRARLGNIYDPTSATAEDRQRVRELMADTSANAYESAILDAGYRGYMNRDYGMIVVLNSDVPVTYEGTISELRERNGGAMRSPTQAPQFSRRQAEQDEEVVQLFESLQGARGLKAVRAKDAAAAHPLGEEILRVHNDFYDILEGLESAGLVQINC
jgi:hypothetical protein